MVEGDDRLIADRVDDLLTPADSMQLWGHETKLQQMVQAYRSGRSHHAWLISGPRGIGKATLAFHFARYVISNPIPENAPQTCKPEDWPQAVVSQVAQSGHPELLHLTRPWDDKTKKFKTQLSVDEIRRTQNFYGMTAGAGGWRITIVDAADDMNASASNALLKILEEPPKRSLFFVITHAAGGLLPTIRSRCQALALNPVPEQEVSQALEHFCGEIPAPQRQQAAALSEGSIRQAIQLARNDVLQHFAAFEKILNSGQSGTASQWAQAHKIAENLAKRGAEDDFDLFIDLVLGWVAQQVRIDASDGAPAVLAGWAEVWEKANQSINQADTFNLDRKQVILTLFQLLFERSTSLR